MPDFKIPEGFVQLSQSNRWDDPESFKSISINQKSIRIGTKIFGMFVPPEQEDRFKARITMYYDATSQSIFAIPDEQGYTYRKDPESRKSAQLNTIPRSFIENKVPRGLYTQDKENPNLFHLAKEDKTALSVDAIKRAKGLDNYAGYPEDTPIEKGDVVCWTFDRRESKVAPIKGKGVATGRVKLLYTGDNDTLFATVEPLSENYLSIFKKRAIALRVNNLTLRKKASDE